MAKVDVRRPRPHYLKRLWAELGRDVDREALLASYLARFEQIYGEAKSGEPIRDRWRERLITLAGKRINSAGELMITAQRFRTQAQNRADARAKLAGLIRAATHKPKPRRKTRPSAAAQRRRLETKRRTGETKRARAKNLSDG